MSFSRFATVAFTVCLCRRPTKKPVTVPAAKREPVSDVDLWPASQQPKGKTSARLESPINITSDESNSDAKEDTDTVSAIVSSAQKKRPVPYVIRFFWPPQTSLSIFAGDQLRNLLQRLLWSVNRFLTWNLCLFLASRRERLLPVWDSLSMSQAMNQAMTGSPTLRKQKDIPLRLSRKL